MYYIHTVYLRHLRHEIKQRKMNLHLCIFYLKVIPRYPPTVYLFQPGLTHVVHGLVPGFMPTPVKQYIV